MFYCIQLYSDVEKFITNLREGTSDDCCFDNHDITTVNIEFDTSGKAVAAAVDIFVSIVLVLDIITMYFFNCELAHWYNSNHITIGKKRVSHNFSKLLFFTCQGTHL